MLVSLKGSPGFSIDQDGIMSITTTWILVDDSSDNVYTRWLDFQNEVNEWVGEVGDPYKRPKQADGSREAFGYEEDNAFTCQNIEYSCVDGRTHYEVTFTNVQNLAAMRQVGNVSVDINNNNERVKTITYQIDVQDDSPLAIDAYLIDSGTTVTWAGDSYLMESSSYQAQTKTRYTITFTAKDMYKMMIGNPSDSVDAFGQKTRKATWRYNTEAYNEWIQPLPGDDASEYIGLSAGSGYLINNIEAAADGVLGYIITIEARHVSLRHVKTDERTYKDGNNISKEVVDTYQSTEEFKNVFDSRVGYESTDDPDIVVEDVSVSQTANGEYEISVTSNGGYGSAGDNSSDIAKATTVSMNSSELVIEPAWAGWALGVSGIDYYAINFPPTTTYTYQMSIQTLIDMNASTSGMVRGWTEQEIIDAIKNNRTIGYDWILYPIGTYTDNYGNVKTGRIPKNRYDYIQVGDVTELVMSGFVYAQPSWILMDEEDPMRRISVRNVYFNAWRCFEVSPVLPNRDVLNNYPQVNGRDLYWQKRYINYKLPMMECSVTKNYRGSASSVTRRDFDSYYRDAVRYIRSSKFTSYKGTNIGFNEFEDQYSNKWTSVTCTIQALMEFYWNPYYDTQYVEN